MTAQHRHFASSPSRDGYVCVCVSVTTCQLADGSTQNCDKTADILLEKRDTTLTYFQLLDGARTTQRLFSARGPGSEARG